MEKLVWIYAGIHVVLAFFFSVFTDPFGIFIVFFAVPAAAAAAVSLISCRFRFWRDKRRGQLPLLLLGTLLFFLEIVCGEIYGSYWFEWLLDYFLIFLIQYGCCLLTLLFLRSLVDKI